MQVHAALSYWLGWIMTSMLTDRIIPPEEAGIIPQPSPQRLWTLSAP